MGCRHKKERGPLGIEIKWCDPCARKQAGPKPAREFEEGWYVVMKSDDHDLGPGVVLRSRVVVHGQATDKPAWTENVTAEMIGGLVEGSAESFERLVAYRPKASKKVKLRVKVRS